MLRFSFFIGFVTASLLSAQAANIWLSSSGNIGSGSTPPEMLGELQTITHPPSDMQGTFFIWARPTPDKTLENWTLRAISSNPSIVSLNNPSIEAFNPVLGNNGIPIVRWQTISEPADPSLSTSSLKGLNIFGTDRMGIGIGPDSDGFPVPGDPPIPDDYVDPLYHQATNAWLLASIDYTLHGVLGQAAIHLQIGELGLNYRGENSSAANVVFGLTNDPALNADTQRNISSVTADLFISVSDVQTPNADFDGDGDIDGRDFLTWQRGHGITSGALPNQGDANFDGAVNFIDLSIWQTQYAQPPPLSAVAVAVPEPSSEACLFLLAVLFIFTMTWDGRRYRCQYRPSVSRRC